MSRKSAGENIKKPNYKRFYKEGEFIKFYEGIADASTVIGRAHKLRNANPISHSSAGLIDNDNTAVDLERVIQDLDTLIRRFCVEKKITSKIEYYTQIE